MGSALLTDLHSPGCREEMKTTLSRLHFSSLPRSHPFMPIALRSWPPYYTQRSHDYHQIMIEAATKVPAYGCGRTPLPAKHNPADLCTLVRLSTIYPPTIKLFGDLRPSRSKSTAPALGELRPHECVVEHPGGRCKLLCDHQLHISSSDSASICSRGPSMYRGLAQPFFRASRGILPDSDLFINRLSTLLGRLLVSAEQIHMRQCAAPKSVRECITLHQLR